MQTNEEKCFTAIFRDVTKEEASDLCNHPKWTAGAWGHALDQRDDARHEVAKLRAQADARPVAWHRLAVAWLRGKAADQAKTNEKYPEHAACYDNWRNVVTYAQKFADELEREAPDTHPEASAPGLSDDEQHALRRAADIAEEHGAIGPAHTLRDILTRASAATSSADARIEELRKGLFEARDALVYASDLLPQRFQAKDHRFFLAAIERANNILSGANNG
ncbi:hypothetical protein LMG19089_02925 [Ralstonia edaphis]|uniref:hypothetical protein n=1 Tax=Ralstonia edaphi TaxID=3058599 RepID=UPI0028F56DEC|nr:hypothetical protein [Ralstonia sp. LMG 6871]CAJ0701783.1 hypothetical protein LMG19089_02925 [Ralstonia sp. LMG 6871]